MASGSVVAAWVRLLRFSPRKSMSSFRPPSAGGGCSPPLLGLKLFRLAQAWTSVPSTEKWSSDRSRWISGCVRMAARNLPEISASSRRSRFLENTRSEEHTSELQSHVNLVCRLLLEKKKKITIVNL